MATSTPATPSADELFMGEAIRIAQTGLELGQYPFGAVIVMGGKSVASAHNSVKASMDPTAHAEVTAIRKACSKLYTTNLEDTTLYSTCEPCLMCLSACFWAGIRRIVFGASVADAAAYGIRQINASARQVAPFYGDFFNIRQGFMREECLALFEKWSKNHR